MRRVSILIHESCKDLAVSQFKLSPLSTNACMFKSSSHTQRNARRRTVTRGAVRCRTTPRHCGSFGRYVSNDRSSGQRLLDNSRIANSRTGRLADWSTRGCHRRLCVLSFPVWRHMRDRELSSPRLVQSASWQSASWRILELSSYPGRYV